MVSKEVTNDTGLIFPPNSQLGVNLRRLAVCTTLLNNTSNAPGRMAMTPEMRRSYMAQADQLKQELGINSQSEVRANALAHGMRWYDMYEPAPPLAPQLTRSKKS